MRRVRTLPHARAMRRVLAAGALVVCAALLAGCGSSARGLIPAGESSPLLGDFEAVQQAAENGGGDCSATNAAISKTEHDFEALSSSVDSGLRSSLRQGIENLGARARELCTQPLASTSTTSTTQKTTPPRTTSTQTTTTPPTTTETTEAEKETSTGTGGAPSEEQKRENPGGGESEAPSGPTGGTEGGAQGASG